MFTHDDVLTALRDDLRTVTGAADGYQRAVVDSRQARPGDLFVAFPGMRVDGNDFVDDAFARGASGVVCEQPPSAVPVGRALYVVPDGLAALQQLARWFWGRNPLRALEITGTVGKTSTKEVAARLFGQRYSVLMSEGGLNGEIGLPLVLLQRGPEHDFAVLELGMHRIGEISLQCTLAPPTYGIVTNIGFTHMERLGSQAAIVEAKRELVEHVPLHGCVALNADDPLVMSMREKAYCGVLTYGQAEDADVRGSELVSRGREGIAFTLTHAGKSVAVEAPLPGAHNLQTCLSVAAIAIADGFSLDDVADGLRTVENPLRLKFVAGPAGSLLIDDTYNAGPASMEAALRVLSEQSGRKLAVLGDMLELGNVEEDCHRRLGRTAAVIADQLYVVGSRSAWTAEAAHAAGLRQVQHLPDKDALIAELKAEIRSGDVVLIKGSRGLALETVVAALSLEG